MNPDQEQGGGLPPGLLSAVRAADQGAGPDTGTDGEHGAELGDVPTPAAAPSLDDEVTAWAGLALSLGRFAAMAYPSLAAVYTPDTCRDFGRDMAPAAMRLGIFLGGGKAGVYFTAGMAAASLGWSTYQAIEADRAAQPAPAPAPSTIEAHGYRPAEAPAQAVTPAAPVQSDPFH